MPKESVRVQMSAEIKTNLPLEIAHILFIDVVGYSKLLVNEQSELLQKLNDVVLRTEQVRTADSAKQLIRLPTGDGMALVFRNYPEAPAECALEIAAALKSYRTSRCAWACTAARSTKSAM